MLSFPAAATLNHLLVQSGWAPPRLAKFTGKTACFHIAPFSFTCTVQDDGTVQTAAKDTSADANLGIPLSLLPRLALHDETAFAQIETSGDAALIEEIIFLAHNLRWDAAEDLSRITGDIAAERIVRVARTGPRQIRNVARNVAQALTEYWTEERPLLAKPQQVAAFAQAVTRLRDEAEQLEQRIQQLSKAK